MSRPGPVLKVFLLVSLVIGERSHEVAGFRCRHYMTSRQLARTPAGMRTVIATHAARMRFATMGCCVTSTCMCLPGRTQPVGMPSIGTQKQQERAHIHSNSCLGAAEEVVLACY
jgi:hypothetical protein